MKAFVEWQCDCHCAGIVRAGPRTDHYGADNGYFEYAVAFKRIGTIALVQALVRPRPLPWWLRWLEWFLPAVPPFTVAHQRAICSAINAEKLTYEWDRLGSNPYQLAQIPGVKMRTRIMKTLHEQLTEQHGGLKGASQGHGLKVGETRIVDMGTDPKTQAAIIRAYADKVESGEHKLGSQMIETYRGGGVHDRSFSLDETPSK